MAKISHDEKLIYSKTAAIVGLFLLIFLIWLWWARVYTSKSNVFNAMFSNSLSTFGVTKTVSQDGMSGKMTQVSQAQFGATNIVHAKTSITQPTDHGDINVVSRTITTPTEDFVTYSSIEMPSVKDKPKIDFSSLLNKWGKSTKAEGGGSAFNEMIFGIVPFGNLPADKKSKLLDIIHSKNVYKTDFSKTQVKSEYGRSVYVYEVEVNVQGYAELLKAYDAILGLKQMSEINPQDYANTPAIKSIITVDKLSRKISKVTISESNQEQSFNGYGINSPVVLPTDVISRHELEGRLQNLLNKAE